MLLPRISGGLCFSPFCQGSIWSRFSLGEEIRDLFSTHNFGTTTRDADVQWEVLDSLIPEPTPRRDGLGRPWKDRRAVLTEFCGTADVPGTDNKRNYGKLIRLRVFGGFCYRLLAVAELRHWGTGGAELLAVAETRVGY